MTFRYCAFFDLKTCLGFGAWILGFRGLFVPFLLTLAVALSAEELPRKTNTPRETYPNVDVVYDFATAPDGKRLRTIITKPREAKRKLPVIFVAAWLSCDSVEAPADTKNASPRVQFSWWLGQDLVRTHARNRAPAIWINGKISGRGERSDEKCGDSLSRMAN